MRGRVVVAARDAAVVVAHVVRRGIVVASGDGAVVIADVVTRAVVVARGRAAVVVAGVVRRRVVGVVTAVVVAGLGRRRRVDRRRGRDDHLRRRGGVHALDDRERDTADGHQRSGRD